MSLLTLSSFISLASPPGIIEPNVKWNKLEVKVCWESEQSSFRDVHDSKMAKFMTEIRGEAPEEYTFFNDEQKLKVQKIVETHYQKSLTGIHFTGWSNCKPGDLSVKLYGVTEKKTKYLNPFSSFIGFLSHWESDYYGMSSIGNSHFKNDKFDAPGEMGTQAMILKTLNTGTILHEFGHLAGLRHEHITDEVQKGEVCSLYSKLANYKFSSSEKMGESAHQVSVPDEYSIMGYCYLHLWKKLNNGEGDKECMGDEVLPPSDAYSYQNDEGQTKYRYLLSIGDLHALRCLYDKNLEAKFCRADFDPKDNLFFKTLHKIYLKRVLESGY